MKVTFLLLSSSPLAFIFHFCFPLLLQSLPLPCPFLAALPLVPCFLFFFLVLPQSLPDIKSSSPALIILYVIPLFTYPLFLFFFSPFISLNVPSLDVVSSPFTPSVLPPSPSLFPPYPSYHHLLPPSSPSLQFSPTFPLSSLSTLFLLGFLHFFPTPPSSPPPSVSAIFLCLFSSS